ncbi:MAG: response regulator transcription factor [Acidobacteriota bacterium]|nr:response regulator transcription factor [Acidobacteriota bacterium]
MQSILNPKPTTDSIGASFDSPIRVVVIEDMRELREGLQSLLNLTPNFQCVKSFGAMDEALRFIKTDNLPDLILTDIGLPRLNGIEGTRILREKFPELPIVVLTVHEEDDQIFQALCAGANGYLLKNTTPARIIEALTEVFGGGAPMSPSVARRVVKLFRTFSPPEHADYHLTEQETQILKMLVDGHFYKTAAFELGISTSTISFHLQNIYGKLHVHSKTEAVAKALREKLI